jgi:hypothetical protein
MKRSVEHETGNIADAPVAKLLAKSAVVGAGFSVGQSVERSIVGNPGTSLFVVTFFLPLLNGHWCGKRGSFWSYFCLPFSLALGFVPLTLLSSFIAEMFYLFMSLPPAVLVEQVAFWTLSIVAGATITVLTALGGYFNGKKKRTAVDPIEANNEAFLSRMSLEDKGDGVFVDHSYDPPLTLKIIDIVNEEGIATAVPLNEVQHGMNAPHKATITFNERGQIIGYQKVND